MPRLRFVTSNLLHGMSLETGQVAQCDLRRAAQAMEGDLVALQEVDRGQDRSNGVDQARAVAEEIGATAWRFVPTLAGTPGPVRTWTPVTTEDVDGDCGSGPTYGVALLSRLPVRSWHVLRLAASPVGAPLLVPGPPRARMMHIPDEPRVAVAAVVDGPRGAFTAVTTHLSFVPGVNVGQLRRVARWAQTLPAPRLLLGDLNLPGAVPRRAVRWHRLARVATYPAYRPRVQFDHVLGSGITAEAVLDVEALHLPVSDHCALAVDLEI